MRYRSPPAYSPPIPRLFVAAGGRRLFSGLVANKVTPSTVRYVGKRSRYCCNEKARGEAAQYWRRYLAGDRLSEWAARARRSLKFCEIQVNSVAVTSRAADSDKAA
jgi:hypothetical protein